jgi:LysR family hydrogen peroxide-inducible transcriptional activator
MQMVANGYGVTPEIAADVDVRDTRVALKRFATPEPRRPIGLTWRKTSPRRRDFDALGAAVKAALPPRHPRPHRLAN